MKRHRLLEPFVAALERLDGRPHDAMRATFAAVARRRPDLLERSLLAERARRTSEIEGVLRRTLAEIELMAQTEGLPPGAEMLHIGHLRLNHATGRLHVGHGSRSILLFPDDAN